MDIIDESLQCAVGSHSCCPRRPGDLGLCRGSHGFVHRYFSLVCPFLCCEVRAVGRISRAGGPLGEAAAVAERDRDRRFGAPSWRQIPADYGRRRPGWSRSAAERRSPIPALGSYCEIDGL